MDDLQITPTSPAPGGFDGKSGSDDATKGVPKDTPKAPTFDLGSFVGAVTPSEPVQKPQDAAAQPESTPAENSAESCAPVPGVPIQGVPAVSPAMGMPNKQPEPVVPKVSDVEPAAVMPKVDGTESESVAAPNEPEKPSSEMTVAQSGQQLDSGESPKSAASESTSLYEMVSPGPIQHVEHIESAQTEESSFENVSEEELQKFGESAKPSAQASHSVMKYSIIGVIVVALAGAGYFFGKDIIFKTPAPTSEEIVRNVAPEICQIDQYAPTIVQLESSGTQTNSPCEAIPADQLVAGSEQCFLVDELYNEPSLYLVNADTLPHLQGWHDTCHPVGETSQITEETIETTQTEATLPLTEEFTQQTASQQVAVITQPTQEEATQTVETTQIAEVQPTQEFAVTQQEALHTAAPTCSGSYESQKPGSEQCNFNCAALLNDIIAKEADATYFAGTGVTSLSMSELDTLFVQHTECAVAEELNDTGDTQETQETQAVAQQVIPPVPGSADVPVSPLSGTSSEVAGLIQSVQTQQQNAIDQSHPAATEETVVPEIGAVSTPDTEQQATAGQTGKDIIKDEIYPTGPEVYIYFIMFAGIQAWLFRKKIYAFVSERM